ncbi:MAG: PD-(D/E)XK nuclease family protein [Dehalococcoidia bacterium]|nr:PD-(D/E)XK nuclease family protein [Dehalococcoidia bacterium]
MSLERRFIGWDAPILAKVQEFLLPQRLTGPLNLEKEIIVVPTQRAGRRLREALAASCAGQHTALLSPRVVTPTFFFYPGDEATGLATPTEVVAAWADVLLRADLSAYGGLFPACDQEQNFLWATRTGEMIQRLRDALAEGGYSITSVLRSFEDVLEETERWRDLASLETTYLEKLQRLGARDPCDFMVERAGNSELKGLSKEIERIVIAAVPDPVPLMVQALERVTEAVDIVVLVHAPESLADHFDDWGRPIAGKWAEARIDIPEPAGNIFLCGSPVTQVHKVMEVIAEEAAHFGPADIAIGVPDSSVTPFLAAGLEDKGLGAFDPSGKSVREHPLYHLLSAFKALIGEGTYTAFSAFLRHADVLNFLQQEHALSPRWLLDELDNFQNRHLPTGWGDITHYFSREAHSEEKGTREFAELEKAVEFIQEQVRMFEDEDFDDAVRYLLQSVYRVRMVDSHDPDDEEFIAVAKLVDAALRELGGDVITSLGIAKRHALELLLQRLSSQRYYPERRNEAVDLEGWLELPWNDAPLLLVTGMNEGFVPDSRLDDIFLPDSLRRQLNLRHDADRLARDAYLMQGLIESRSGEGRVCFLVSKTSIAGDPIKPSRLLFHCSDAELPHRAGYLFGDSNEKQDNYPPSVCFLLETAPPVDVPESRLELKKMPVTAFGDYLECPFRFYLRRVLEMEGLDDEKGEMDALDFGVLVHHVLQEMANFPGMSQCTDDGELSRFLCARADKWIAGRFGSSIPLQIEIQLDAAKQRLAAAARVQTALTGEGWEILKYEEKVEAELYGMLVRGQVDRIDRHRETGRIRILDYKTSDKARSPGEVHLQSPAPGVSDYAKVVVDGKEKRWLDLQLPLYVMLLAEKDDLGEPVKPGYFNLPKTTGDTGVAMWDDFDDELLESAGKCARGVIDDVRNRIFWPPSAKVQYDNFESLFHADIAGCIDIEKFKPFMGKASR